MAVLSHQLWIGLLGLTHLGDKYSKTKLCVFPRHSCDLDPWLPTRLTQLDWEVLQSTKESEADKKRQTWTRVPCVLIKTPKFVLIVAASVADPPREQTSNLSSNGLRVITLLLPKMVDERWKEEREREKEAAPLGPSNKNSKAVCVALRWYTFIVFIIVCRDTIFQLFGVCSSIQKLNATLMYFSSHTHTHTD